jgi:hypothetical protein
MFEGITGLARSIDVQVFSGVVACVLNAHIAGIINVSVVGTWSASSFTILDFTINAINPDASSLILVREGFRRASITGSVD